LNSNITHFIFICFFPIQQERKDIAARIIEEHRNDRQKRIYTKPVKGNRLPLNLH